MADGFVIMQIGDVDLEEVYELAIAPAIAATGLEPRRIDLDNEGGLLKSEIVRYLESSDIIIADLTNERPNCYLEVGYAMGLGRNRHLILTVRSDHLPGNPSHVAGGPKVHFDLAGYDLLIWSRDDLDALREELTQRIQRRLAITRDTALLAAPNPPDWTVELHERGLARIRNAVGPGYMELAFGLNPPKIQRSPHELLEASHAAVIHTFGWPIALTLNDDDSRARPTGNGVRAVVDAQRIDGEHSYDLWELRTDGDFFMIQSLFEDQRGRPSNIFFDTRIVRVAEALLFCARLYERLDVPPDAAVRLRVAHGGLTDRLLTSSSPDRHLSGDYRTIADRVEADVTFTVGAVAGRLVELVKELLGRVFETFDFFQLGESVYEDIVNNFVKGRLV